MESKSEESGKGKRREGRRGVRGGGEVHVGMRRGEEDGNESG